MNGSRSTPPRHGDRSSLDALNRTIEGLEARIEGLMTGTGRDSRPQRAADNQDSLQVSRQDPRQGSRQDHRQDLRQNPQQDPRRAQRPAQPATNAYRPAEPAHDPISEIRERQRMLEAGRAPRNAPLRQEEPRYAEPRRTEIRPPEAYRPPAPVRAEASFRAEPPLRSEAPLRAEMPRYAASTAPAPRRDMPQRPAPQSRAPAPQPLDSGMHDIAQALVNLRHDLKQDISEGVAREMNALRSEIRSIKSVAEDQRFAEDLRGDLARLADGINQLGYQASPEAAGLRAEFEDLRTVMDGLAREDSVQRMEHRWQGLEDRMHDVDSVALRDEIVALAYRIDDIKGQLGEMSDSPVIRALEQKLMTVAGAMEQIGSRMQPNDGVIAEQFATLDQRLDEISRAIAAASRASAASSIDQSFLQRLDGRISALADQIEMMGQAVHLDTTEVLSARIEALTGRIEELSDEHAAMRLEERLEQLSMLMEQAQRPAQNNDLFDHLADISHKIDGLERGSVNDVLTERLDYLARRIEEMDIQPRHPADQNAFGRIEDRLSDIAARLDEATAAPRGDAGALRSLEDQIAHLSALIAQPQTGFGAANGMSPEFDNRMAAIEGYMATNDEYIIEAARQAAEAVVEAYSRNPAAAGSHAAADMAALAGLADDLRHLEDLTRSSEERTHHTFEALHSTLVQIADRLDGMEDRLSPPRAGEPAPRYREPDYREPLRAAAMPAAAPLVMPSEHEPVYDLDEQYDEDPAAARAFGTRAAAAVHADAETMLHDEDVVAPVAVKEKVAKPSLLTELSRRFLPGGKGGEPLAKAGRTTVEPTPSIDPSDVLPANLENDLLEPGSGAPDVKKILERVRASQAAGDFDNARSVASGSERADYIAAARRAAKAAAQETDPSQGNAPAKDLRKAAKPATAKGSLGSAFAKHRRPILMAVGAVLLVLMTVPLVGKLTGGSKAPAQQPAQIETPAQPATPARVTGSIQLPSSDSQVAGDSVDSGTDVAAVSPPPVLTQPQPAAQSISSAPRQVGTSNLMDPHPGGGQPSAMQPPTSAAPAQNGFAPTQKTDAGTAQPQASAAIAVPADIAPKSLADAAAAGDPNALFEIGARYTDGRGVKADLAEAANWYKLAADRGLAPAQYRLANQFEKGTGVARDLPKAITYYKQAADAGNASAMHNLAVLYASGAAGQPDYAQAVNWFAKAADFGVADSQFNLAILYARGNGAKQDLEESYKWFAVAAKGGDKDAAQKRDEVANAMRKEQLESARAKVDLWKVKALDPKANTVNLPDEWASGKSVTTASVPTAEMEKAIRNIQGILNKNGFDAGKPDGKLGGKTVIAIKAFQTSVGQEPTGKINDALVKELLARNK